MLQTYHDYYAGVSDHVLPCGQLLAMTIITWRQYRMIFTMCLDVTHDGHINVIQQLLSLKVVRHIANGGLSKIAHNILMVSLFDYPPTGLKAW